MHHVSINELVTTESWSCNHYIWYEGVDGSITCITYVKGEVKPHAMKTWRVEVKFHTFLALEQVGGELLVSHSDRFTSSKRSPGTP